MRIAELAHRVGIAPSAVRWYEQAGVLPAAERAETHWGPQARYGDETWEVPVLAQVAGLTIDDGVIARVVAALGSPDRGIGRAGTTTRRSRA